MNLPFSLRMGEVLLALGYDTERPYGALAETEEGKKLRKRQLAFVRKLIETLDSEAVPRTFFILGNYLERCLDDYSCDDLKEIYDKGNSLNELQQHSYSHLVFRHIQGMEGRRVVSQGEFAEDIKRASAVLDDILDVKPNGIRTPVGYHHDLTDMPEIIAFLASWGFRYVSSDLRSETTFEGALILERQPHSYGHIGYSGMLEIPSVSWQDTVFTEYGRTKYKTWCPHNIDNADDIVRYYKKLFSQAEKMAKTESAVFLPLCLHPWAVMEYDSKLEVHKRILNAARDHSIKIIFYGDIAEGFLKNVVDKK